MPKYPCTKACQQCESIFTISRAYNRHQKFCSRACASLAQRTRDKLKLSHCRECDAQLQGSRYQTSFCSRSCATINHNRVRGQRRDAVNQHVVVVRITRSQIRRLLTSQTTSSPREHYVRHCSCCQTPLTDNKKKYCSSCFPNSRHYRSLAQFKFNVYDYPNEFDLNLIHQHGWFSPNGYKSRNKQPNLSGVSRDHLYTVADGFKNKVDAKLLAHPANCAILLHNGAGGNNSKRKSSITLDALRVKIDEWDRKYGQK